MMGFHFHALPLFGGRFVELRVYHASTTQRGKQIGELIFTPGEWEGFRVILVAGIRAAGYARIPVEFLDGTRKITPAQG